MCLSLGGISEGFIIKQFGNVFGCDKCVEFVGEAIDFVCSYPLVVEGVIGVGVLSCDNMRPLVGCVARGEEEIVVPFDIGLDVVFVIVVNAEFAKDF